jgi:hypothetical protein
VLVPHDRTPLGYGLSIAVGLVLFVCLVVVCVEWMMHRDKPGRGAHGFVWTLAGVSVLLTAATLAYAMLPRDPWPVGGGLPGFGMTITVLFAVQMGLLVVNAVVAFAVRPKGTFLGGLAGPVVASLGLGIEVAASAGVSYRVADFLNRGGLPASADYSGDRPQPLEPPPSYEWASIGVVLLLVVVAVVAVFARTILMRRLHRYGRVVTDADFRGGRGVDAKRAKAIDYAVADALISDHVGRLVAWVYAPSALAAVVITGLALLGVRPVRLVPARSAGADVLAFTMSAGTYLIGLAALALIVVGVLAYRYQRFRRVVGVLWDLGTFWPRAAHPLAPPCYAERVVPELAKRSAWLATEQGGVIISGHSQGSVLAAATVLQMPPSARPSSALLTYGSPIRRLYVRLFPAYWSDAVLYRVGQSVADPAQHTPRWVNLWRDTDPIGGPVSTPAHDVRLVDPPGFGFLPGDSVFPAVDGHGNYQLHPMYGEAVSALVLGLPEQQLGGAPPVLPQPPPPPAAAPDRPDGQRAEPQPAEA